MQEYSETNLQFIRLITRRKWWFIILTIVAAGLSFLFSSGYFIRPRYMSTAIVYPVNLKPYSTESESEQLLQLLQSDYVRNAVVRKFNLASVYDIDTLEAGWMSRLIHAYDNNIEIGRTQFESVEIDALDTDPARACAMVNEIIAALNEKASLIQKQKAAEVVAVFADALAYKRHEMDSLNSALEELRVKYQILDYKSQAKEATRQYLRALSSGKAGAKDIDVMMRNLGEKGGEYYEMQKTLDGVIHSYNSVTVDYDNAWRDLNKKITYVNIVTEPVPADKKTYPIRWLIMVISVISANLLLFVMVVWVQERNRKPE